MGLFYAMGLLCLIVTASRDEVQASDDGDLIEFLVWLVKKHYEKIDDVMDELKDAMEDISDLKLKLTASESSLKIAKEDIKNLKKKLSYLEEVDEETLKDMIALTKQQAETNTAVQTVDGKVNEVDEKYFDATQNLEQRMETVEDNAGIWPPGSYCILASGACPKGFTKHSAYMKALKMAKLNAKYLKTDQFGDSSIGCHGYCQERYGVYADLEINSCCK